VADFSKANPKQQMKAWQRSLPRTMGTDFLQPTNLSGKVRGTGARTQLLQPFHLL